MGKDQELKCLKSLHEALGSDTDLFLGRVASQIDYLQDVIAHQNNVIAKIETRLKVQHDVPHEKVIVNFKCPECGAISSEPLAKANCNLCWVCPECDAPEDRDDYENFPEVISVTIKKEV